MGGNVALFNPITLLNTGVAFFKFPDFGCHGNKGTLPALLNFWTFVQTFLPNFG